LVRISQDDYVEKPPFTAAQVAEGLDGFTMDIVLHGSYAPAPRPTALDGFNKRYRLAGRFLERSSLIAAIAFVALLGAGALCLRVTKTYEVVEQVNVPAGAPGITDASLHARAVDRAAAMGVRATSGTLLLRSGATPGTLLITASADTPGHARTVADSAASSALNLASGAPLLFAGVRNLGASPQYRLAYATERPKMIELWAAICALTLIVAWSVPVLPARRERIVVARGPLSSDFVEPRGERIDVLQTLAGVLLKHRCTENGSIHTRAIVLDFDPALKHWLSRDETVNASDGEEMAEVHSPRRLLVTRSAGTRIGGDSLHAVIALGRSLAAAGAPTAIVDADLGQEGPEAAAHGFPAGLPGVRQILAGTHSYQDCCLEDDEHPGLTAVAAGFESGADSPDCEQLASDSMETLLDDLAQNHTVILIHGPMASQIPPATLQQVDATLIAVAEDEDDEASRLRAISEEWLSGLPANLIGRIVLCDDAG
jgi:hypothetical protein